MLNTTIPRLSHNKRNFRGFGPVKTLVAFKDTISGQTDMHELAKVIFNAPFCMKMIRIHTDSLGQMWCGTFQIS